MNLRRKRLFLLPIVALILIVAACAQAPSLMERGAGEPPRPEGGSMGRPAAAPTPPRPVAAPAAAPQVARASDAAKVASEALAGPGAPPQPAAPPQLTGRPDGDRPSAGAAQQAPVFLDQKIIRTATINLAVQDVGKSVEDVTRLVREVRGFVAASNSRQEGDRQIASLTLRVPVESFDDVMGGLRRLAIKVNDENSTSQDVTEEFTDLDAQRRNLEVAEAQYQEFMKRATTLDEVLKIQQRLTEVRNQIERIKGRLNYLDRRASFSTITVTLALPLPENAQPTTRPGWDPIKVVERAWEASLRVLRGIAEVVITVVVFVWWLIPLLFAAWYFANAVRGRRARHEA